MYEITQIETKEAITILCERYGRKPLPYLNRVAIKLAVFLRNRGTFTGLPEATFYQLSNDRQTVFPHWHTTLDDEYISHISIASNLVVINNIAYNNDPKFEEDYIELYHWAFSNNSLILPEYMDNFRQL